MENDNDVNVLITKLDLSKSMTKDFRQLMITKIQNVQPNEYINKCVHPNSNDFTRVIQTNPVNLLGYRNYQVFLENWYQIVKKDFVNCFKNGIRWLKTFTNNSYIVNNNRFVSVFNNCRVVFQRINSVYEIEYNCKIDIGNSLIYGQIICISHDFFDKELIFAVVQENVNGLLKVKLLETNVCLERHLNYIIIKPMAYYEAIKYILLNLKYAYSCHPNEYMADMFVQYKSNKVIPKYLRGINVEDYVNKAQKIQTLYIHF